ncbi:MAG: aldo/keto reductase [Deltaproteobacteria bacterium]|nr:aldo/keto reductase [Deltaproteobacteria bacterium]
MTRRARGGTFAHDANRTLGRSGISVGEVGLGTWGISGEGYGPSLELTSRATLRAAIDAGGSFIETADCYREGEMLEWIGDLKRDVGADKVFASVRVGVNRDPVQPVPRKDFSARTSPRPASGR